MRQIATIAHRVLAVALALALGACNDDSAVEKDFSGGNGKNTPEMTKALAQCDGEGNKSVPVSLARDVQPILDMNCVACHQAAAPEHDLVLEAGLSHDAMVGPSAIEAKMPVVSPGDPSQSYLYRKIAGTHLEVGGNGARMPLGGQLDAASIQTICRWIASGAADN